MKHTHMSYHSEGMIQFMFFSFKLADFKTIKLYSKKIAGQSDRLLNNFDGKRNIVTRA